MAGTDKHRAGESADMRRNMDMKTIGQRLLGGAVALWVGLGAVEPAVAAPGQVLAWGDNANGQINVPATATLGVTAIAAGVNHSLALKQGQVSAWGNNFYGQTAVPATAALGVTAIAAGANYSLALKNGQVLAWGNNSYGQINIPTAAQADVRAIAAGANHSLAMKSGQVIAWGDNAFGQTSIPAAANAGITAIAAGDQHSLALKNGQVLAWGGNSGGQITVPSEAASCVTAIAAGAYHSLALKNGQVIAWGHNYYGQTTVPATSGVVGLSGGAHHTLAIVGCYARMYWQSPSGTVAEWTVNEQGDMLYSRVLSTVGPDWKLKAVGDIDGDGIEDLLWQRSGDGFLAGWFMTLEGTIRNTCCWGSLGNWELKACADYSADGQNELFFQRPDGAAALWFIGPNGAFSNALALGNAGAWIMKGAGDLNRNNYAEVFWQRADGTVAVWDPGMLVNAATGQRLFGTQVINVSREWELRAVSDIDGDGVADLLWQTAQGWVGGWFMNNNGTVRDARGWWNTGTWRLCGAARKR